MTDGLRWYLTYDLKNENTMKSRELKNPQNFVTDIIENYLVRCSFDLISDLDFYSCTQTCNWWEI